LTTKLSRKNKNKAFIKLQEHMAISMFELEVIEAEDCTQEMDDMVGNINMIETGYGNLTGMNQHLAKEKSHIFEEANKYIKNFDRGQPVYDSPPQPMFNQSMIQQADQSVLLRRHTSMGNFGFGNTLAPPRQSGFHNSMQHSMNMSPSVGNLGFGNQTMHQHSSSRHNNSQFIKSNDQMANNSMFMNSTMNMTSGTNSQYFMSNQRNHMPPQPPRPPPSHGFKRRQTIRQSVLHQYNKFSTMRQGLNESVLRPKTKMRTLKDSNNFNIYSQSDLSNLEANRVNI
jgi:hypothetical protein